VSLVLKSPWVSKEKKKGVVVVVVVVGAIY